jgi:hypothetical protein
MNRPKISNSACPKRGPKAGCPVDTPVKGKTQVVRGSEPKMRGERTFKVRERAFSALTKQYAVEFFDPFWTTSNRYRIK